MQQRIFAAEISLEHAPSSVREKLSGNEDHVRSLIQKLQNKFSEVLVLSTGNRFVVYAVGDSVDPLLNHFLQDGHMFRYVQFYKNTEASVNHLFAVASGLASAVKGEHHVLSEITRAYEIAGECGAIGLILDNIVRKALRVGKKVRTETGIDKFCSSVVDTGLDLIYSRLENIYDCTFLILGTGKVSQLALSYLHREGIPNVMIASDDINQANALANQYKASVIGLENICEYFQQADVIIGGMHQPVPLCAELLNGVCSKHVVHDHSRKKHIILDFGTPRNFDHKLRNYPIIELYNLDELKALEPSPLDLFGGIDEAWKIVSAEAQKSVEVLVQLEQVPVLAAYWKRLVNMGNHQLRFAMPRFKNAAGLDGKLVESLAHNVMRHTSGGLLKNLTMLTGNTQVNLKTETVKTLSDFRIVPLNLFDN